jgi:hypothetical protein
VRTRRRTGTTLEVLDDAGVAFLRLGPAGAEANVNAAEWYRTALVGNRAVPELARAGTQEPAWVRVSSDPAWGWYDRRLRTENVPVPPVMRAAARAGTVGYWTIPLRFGGAPVTLGGSFRFAPPPPGTFRARLKPGDPLPGVHVSLVSGRVPALYLENLTEQAVVVLGAAGEPFLRVGPEGTSANVLSPTWQRSGKAEVTTSAMPIDPQAEPAWRFQSPSPRYAWVEFRAAHAADDMPPDISRRAFVGRWSVPLRRGAERGMVKGVVEWIPARSVSMR